MDDYHGHDPPIDPPPSSTTTTTTASSSSPTRQRSNYIPRAPNAFILFRSAFIRSQRISGSVEGNHSRLSQIIGSYWNALPAHEKEEWEAKAAVALEEHRRRYPDWRFVNAQSQSRRGRGREGEGRAKRARGRGRKRKPEGERVELIRDLLVEGMEGEQLAKAVEDWEKSKKIRKPIASTSAHDPCATTQSSPDLSSAYQTPPASSSSAATSASYPVSSFSSLSGWAGQYPTDVPSPTAASFPSSSMSPAAYPGFTPYTYYDEFNPPATYEEPMPYDNPYAYPAYSHARQDSGDPTTIEPEFLPYEPVLESSNVPSPPPGPADIPEIQGQQFQWQAWQPPPPRKGKERAQPPPHPIDEYGWGVPSEDSQPHPNN